MWVRTQDQPHILMWSCECALPWAVRMNKQQITIFPFNFVPMKAIADAHMVQYAPDDDEE